MRKLLLLLGLLTLTACTAQTDPAATAPPGTVSRYPSTAPPVPPSAVARENAATTAAALPTDVPGYTRATASAVLKLCPTTPQEVPDTVVHAFGAWQSGDQTLTVAAVLDQQHPADQLLATLAPTDCPDKDNEGGSYLYDRQPYESPDGWTGTLNTSMRTAPDGTKHYEAIYLLSKGDALVNVIAGRPVAATVNYDPDTDEVAANYTRQVLNRFAV